MTISAKSLGDNDLRGLCIFLNRPNLFNINDLGTLLGYVCICTCVYVRVYMYVCVGVHHTSGCRVCWGIPYVTPHKFSFTFAYCIIFCYIRIL